MRSGSVKDTLRVDSSRSIIVSWALEPVAVSDVLGPSALRSFSLGIAVDAVTGVDARSVFPLRGFSGAGTNGSRGYLDVELADVRQGG